MTVQYSSACCFVNLWEPLVLLTPLKQSNAGWTADGALCIFFETVARAGMSSFMTLKAKGKEKIPILRSKASRFSKASRIFTNPVASRKAWMLFKGEHKQAMCTLFLNFAGLWLMHLQQLKCLCWEITLASSFFFLHSCCWSHACDAVVPNGHNMTDQAASPKRLCWSTGFTCFTSGLCLDQHQIRTNKYKPAWSSKELHNAFLKNHCCICFAC